MTDTTREIGRPLAAVLCAGCIPGLRAAGRRR
jgi:hypothetical protein